MQRVCAFGGVHVLIIVKQQHFAVFGFKRHHLAQHAVVPLVKFTGGGRQIVERNAPVRVAQPRRAKLIPAGVDGDRNQPRFGVFALAQRMQALVGFQKNLLRRVLGQSAILQNDVAQAENVVAVGLHQLAEPFVFFRARNRGMLHVVHLLTD